MLPHSWPLVRSSPCIIMNQLSCVVFPNTFVCIYVVYMFMCLRVYVHTYAWRPDGNIRCLPQLLSTLLLGQGLSLNPEVTDLASLGGQQTVGIFLPLLLQHCEYRYISPLQAFYMCAGIQTQIFMLVQQTFYSLIHLIALLKLF